MPPFVSLDNSSQAGPHIENPKGLPLPPEAEEILPVMFADYGRVVIQGELGGGLGGGRVLLVRPIKEDGQPELPAVVKLAPVSLINEEWSAYEECIRDRLVGVAEIKGEPVIPVGACPACPEPGRRKRGRKSEAEGITWAGLRYPLMGGGEFEIESLHSFCRRADVEDICYTLKERLFKGMDAVWRFSYPSPAFHLRRSYDRVLPINLLVEPTAPPPGARLCLLKPDVSANQPFASLIASSPAQGDYVRVEGFVITEVDPAQGAVTLNLPVSDDSYRLRLRPVEAVETYRVNDIITPLEGKVIANRHTMLRDLVEQAFTSTGSSGLALETDAIALPSGVTLSNPLAVWPDILGEVRDVKIACIHGDFNLENILVDPATRDVRLIDFARARRDHVLHDLLRLETEILIKLIPEALAEAGMMHPQDGGSREARGKMREAEGKGVLVLADIIYAFYEQLHHATSQSSRITHHASRVTFDVSRLEKPFRLLVAIREAARDYLFKRGDWSEYYQGLVLYLLGALKFKNLDRLPTTPLPKQVAFWAAGAACNLIEPLPPAGVPVTPRLTERDWERLQRYLPADVRWEVQLEQKTELCTEHLNQLLRTVVTYLPHHLALELLREPAVAENKGQFLEGTLLFVDISGFTALSERLRESEGKAGAEKLVQFVNEYLDAMLCILFRYSGWLVKFGGDAILCLFTGRDQGAMNAVQAAWEMKEAMTHFAEIKVLQETYETGMKVGCNSGLLFAARVGTAEHMEYILTGSAVERTAQAESAARRGDVIISRETYELVRDNLDIEELAEEPGFYRVINLAGFGKPVRSEDLWAEIEKVLSEGERDLWRTVERLDALTPYLPAGVLSQLANDPRQERIAGQHRPVTVLFANLVGMSKVIRIRGDRAEVIAAELGRYFKAMQEVIQAHGGAINKVDLYDKGDKLVVIFGAPRADAKDTYHAALTALKMQEAMRKLSFPTARFLSQRIGINSGFVFAGNVGSSRCNRREYTVMGDVVNLAARLMSAAKAGQVLISQGAWDQIKADFEAEGLEPIQVKGMRDLIPVYLLQAARDRKGERISHLIYSEMVGREAELAKLQGYFRDVVLGKRKRIVAISGEAGIGKTRLVQEWQKRIGEPALSIVEGSASQRIGEPALRHPSSKSRGEAEKSATWLVGRGRAYGKKAHSAFIEIIEQLLGFAGNDTPEECWGKLSAQLEDFFPELDAEQFDEYLDKMAYLGHLLALDLSVIEGLKERVERLDDKTRQIQMRLAACDLIEHAAQKKPLVLLLEDFHWADASSLDMLEFAWDRIKRRTPVLFCLIHRPQVELPGHPVWQQVIRPEYKIELKELDEQLLWSLLQTRQLPESFEELILRTTNGNPLYVEEVLRTLIEDGVLVRQDGTGWRVARSIAHVRVPDTLYKIVQSRIDELEAKSPGTRQLLWMAAVAGEEFPEDLVLHLFTGAGGQEDRFWDYLDALQRADMVYEVNIGDEGHPRWGYRFQHGLIHKVAYESMLVAKRREYHCGIARWMEEAYSGDLQRHYAILANDYDKGEQWEKAFEYHWLAAEREAQAAASRGVVFHLGRMLEIASYVSPGIDTLAQVHFKLGEALAVTGEFDSALERLEEAYNLFGDIPERSAVSNRARVCYHIGRVYERKGGGENLKTALTWQSKGLALLPETPTPEAALLHVLGGIVGFRQGDWDRVDKESQRALDLAQATGAKAELARAHLLLSMSLRNQGRLDLAMFHCQKGIEVDRELPDLIALAKDYSSQGVIAFEMDDWHLAQEAYLQAIGMLECVGDQYQLAMTCCNLGDLYYHLGDIEQGLAYARRGLDIFTRMKSHQGIIFARGYVLAPLFWRQGELEQARTQLLEAGKLVEKHNVVEFKPAVGRWLAQLYLTEGNVIRAEAELRALLSLEKGALGVEFEPIQRLWGQVLAAQGKLAEAVQVLQESLERLEQDQARYKTACALLALAEVLAQMESKAAQVRAYIERARKIFAELGARLDLQEADELIAKL